MVGTRSMWEEIRNAYKVPYGKPPGKRSLEITKHRDNIKTDHKEQGVGVWTGVNWL